MTELQKKDTMQELESLKSALAAILNRISSLETAIQQPAASPADASEAVAAAPAPAPVAVEAEEITDEVMLAISAAVAAFLGERAHVRAVRLARTGAWAQQGRVFIQASHRISVQHNQYQYR